ncbi:31561_t:CDS:2, partial [Racocetra persica]
DFETLKEAYAAISKSKYAVLAKREPQLKASRKRNFSGDFNQTYSVQLTPVCHKRLPHNERELRDAILAILNVLNLLHEKGRNGQKPEFHLDHWPESAYNKYDYKCDLFLVDKLFDQLSFTFSPNAQELCDYLEQQRFNNCNE